jgi:hypothetical protein
MSKPEKSRACIKIGPGDLQVQKTQNSAVCPKASGQEPFPSFVPALVKMTGEALFPLQEIRMASEANACGLLVVDQWSDE